MVDREMAHCCCWCSVHWDSISSISSRISAL